MISQANQIPDRSSAFMYQVTLKPVYSCPALEPEDVNLPQGWTLVWHQAETLKAIRDPNIDVIFNTAMTGDGKSLAAYLNSLQGERYYAMGMYPTNELARDQEIQLNRYIEQFPPNDEPRVNRLSGADLEIYAESEGIRKGEAIKTRIEQSEIIQSNPDILHYLRQHAYLTPKDRPDQIWSQLDTKFKLFIFDEFHVFSAPQIASVINTMLLVRHTNRRKKYLFLSATPEAQIIERLKKAGFRHKIIDPYSEDKYQFPDTPEQERRLRVQEWRQVAREISLTFIPLEPTYKASENWIWEHRELILTYFKQHPGSKGAIILNSIAAVKRLTPLLKDFLHPLQVEENTSLTGRDDKARSLQADLVVGTSTIDVGVDFKINFLIFESADAGNFIQRLGRLGRHDGYDKNGQKIPFNHFSAYALTPNYLVGKLFEAEAVLEPNGVYDRPFFHAQIKDNYRQINNFERYYSRWAGVLSVYLSKGLAHPTIKQEWYAESRAAFREDCQQVFGTSLGKVKGCIKKWGQEWQEMSGNSSGNPIVGDACSFRGSSSLQCGLCDLTEKNEADQFKTYNLPGILSNLEIEPMSKAAFMRSLEETAQRTGQTIPKGRFNYCLAFMKLHRYREERLNWKFTYAGDLDAITDSWKVQVLLGIRVVQPENRWINEVNKCLKRQGLVSYVVPCAIAEVKQRLRLPMHFEIYPLDEAGRDDKPVYSIAFGQSALLLDSLNPAYRFRGKGEETWIC